MKRTDDHLHLGGFNPPETLEGWLSEAEKLMEYKKSAEGSTRGIILTMGEKYANEIVAVCEKYPYFSWCCNFEDEHPETVEDRMRKYKEMGCVGVGEFAINRKITDPMIQAVFAAAEKLELPVLFHMSPEEGFNYGIVDDPGLPLLDEALAKYPNLKIVGHSQPFWMEMSADAPTDREGRNGRGSGPVVPGGAVPTLLKKHPNLYGDISAGSGFFGITRDEEFGLKFLEEFQDQIMYGTDTGTPDSGMHYNIPLWNWLEDHYAAGQISETVMRKICYENAEKVFGVKNPD